MVPPDVYELKVFESESIVSRPKSARQARRVRSTRMFAYEMSAIKEKNMTAAFEDIPP